MSHETMQVEVYADVVCPWCFIGARRLASVVAERGDMAVEVTYRPYLLDPTTPPEGVDLKARLRAKYGVDPVTMFGRVEAEARAEGIPLDLMKVERTYSSLKALTLVRSAPTAAQGAAMMDSFYTHYFIDGGGLWEPGPLVGIAARHGVEPARGEALLADAAELDRTRRMAEQAGARGIRGVPFFVFDGMLAVSGAQPREVFGQVIDKVLAER